MILGEQSYVEMPSGLLLPEAMALREIKAHQRPKAMDFFAGAGGFSLGFIEAGFEVVAAVEYDASAVHTYMTNLCRWGQVQIHFVTDADQDRFKKHMSKVYKRAGAKVVDGHVVEIEKVTGSLPAAGTGWISHEPASTPGVSHIFMGDVRHLESERILETVLIRLSPTGARC